MQYLVTDCELVLRPILAKGRNALVAASKKNFGVIQVGTRRSDWRAAAEAQPSRKNMTGFSLQYYFTTLYSRSRVNAQSVHDVIKSE